MTPTPAQQAAVEQVLAAVDALADAWAVEVGLTSILKNISSPMELRPFPGGAERLRFRNRMEATTDALVRQAFMEAYLRGYWAGRDYPNRKPK